MKCDGCGHWNGGGQKFCESCGAAMAQKRKCSQGHTIPPGVEHCPYCPAPASAGSGRAGTVVVSREDLPGTPQPPADVPLMPRSTPMSGRIAGKSDNRKRTMVVTADERMGVPAPVPSSTASAGFGRAPNVGAPAPGGVPSVSSPLSGFLVSFSHDPNGDFWPLRRGRTRIGSDQSSDIRLTSAGVSSVHANINIHADKDKLKIWITDNDSMNGTRVNGDQIFNNKPDLNHGDLIGICDVEMQLILLK